MYRRKMRFADSKALFGAVRNVEKNCRQALFG
jgi:hypothetical protein